jgi:hypothetical protein
MRTNFRYPRRADAGTRNIQIFGIHAVEAALANPRRARTIFLATRNKRPSNPPRS